MLLRGRKTRLLLERFLDRRHDGKSDELAELGMFARTLEKERRLTVGDDDCLIRARTRGKSRGIAARRHEFLQRRRLRLRAGHESTRKNSGRQIGVDDEHDVDRAAFFLRRLVVGCRIADAPAVRFHAARYDRRYGQFLVASRHDRGVFHVRRRTHARGQFRRKTKPLCNDLHALDVRRREGLAGHSRSLRHIAVEHRLEILMVAAVVKRSAEYLAPPAEN